MVLRFWHVGLCTALLACPCESADQFELIGTARFAGDAVDLSDDATLLENGEPRNRLGGFSALEWTGKGNHYVALPDRGPDDGAVGYPCRVQLLDIDIAQGTSDPVTATLTATQLLTDAHGRSFTGSSIALEASATWGHRLDPEAIRLADSGNFFLSDEYGPTLGEFTASGRMTRSIELPDYFRVRRPDADKATETLANEIGRATNRGMECLALSPDSSLLVGLMQGPLIQDGDRNETGIVIGRNCRLVTIDLATGRTSEFIYQMASDLHGNSEITALSNSEFLVLERDSLAGELARYRKLVRISLDGATSVSGREVVRPSEIGQSIVPVTRTDFLDLLDPEWNLAGASMPEKIEGLTFGPDLADGRRSLLISTDNDFESANPTLLWVFAVSPDQLARRAD